MSRGTLLFLEDDQDLQSLVSAWLRERGYEVETARTVKEARTVMACLRVDAAIVDGLLPGMMGTDFIQELRQRHPTLPLHVQHEPWTPQELLLRVEQLLAVRPTPPPPSNDDLDATFQALCAEYGSRLGEKMRELTEAMERARTGSVEGMEAAFQLVHKLHGTAGSYGFHAVSAAARHLEALLRPARDVRGPADWKALEAAWNELTTAAAATASNAEPAHAHGDSGARRGRSSSAK
jgi:DNA-binding NtrC family response regulator